MPKIRVFTKAYRPFIMGGDCHAPIAAEVEALGPHDLGKGFQGYLVTSPSGKTHVAEATTGGFVGESLDAVRQDVAGCDDVAMMQGQVAMAAEKAKSAELLPPDEFWSYFKEG